MSYKSASNASLNIQQSGLIGRDAQPCFKNVWINDVEITDRRNYWLKGTDLEERKGEACHASDQNRIPVRFWCQCFHSGVSVKPKERRLTRADKIPKRRKTSEHVTNIEIRIRMMII